MHIAGWLCIFTTTRIPMPKPGIEPANFSRFLVQKDTFRRIFIFQYFSYFKPLLAQGPVTCPLQMLARTLPGIRNAQFYDNLTYRVVSQKTTKIVYNATAFTQCQIYKIWDDSVETVKYGRIWCKMFWHCVKCRVSLYKMVGHCVTWYDIM